MNHDVIDRLRQANPYGLGDVTPLTEEREAAILEASRTELSGPLRRSWLVAASAGLVIGLGGLAIWFAGGGGGNPLSTDQTTVATTGTSEPEGAATTQETFGPIEKIEPIEIRCSSELNGTNLSCLNLIDGTSAYWNDNSLRGEGAVIIAEFAEPIQLEQIQFINIEDDESFRRNYRIRGVEIVTDDQPDLSFFGELPNDNSRPHAVTTPSIGTTQVTIQVVSTWPSEMINGRGFDELAIDEIQFWGRRPGSEQAPSPDQASPSTAAPTTHTTLGTDQSFGPIELIAPVHVECSSELIAKPCSNLIDGTPAYWNDKSLAGEDAVITVTFGEPVQLEQVQILNLSDDERFRRNYRIREVDIIADDQPEVHVADDLPDTNTRPHAITMVTTGTHQVVIRITRTWPSEDVGGSRFFELAIEEIEFWGRLPTADSRVRSDIPDWVEDYAHQAGYVAFVAERTPGCVLVVTVAQFNADEFAEHPCDTQSGDMNSAYAFSGFADSFDTVFAGQVRGEATDVYIRSADEELLPEMGGTVWLFVIHNPDGASKVVAEGFAVVLLPDGSILTEVGFVPIEVSP